MMRANERKKAQKHERKTGRKREREREIEKMRDPNTHYITIHTAGSEYSV